jgi:hypothetical protein
VLDYIEENKIRVNEYSKINMLSICYVDPAISAKLKETQSFFVGEKKLMITDFIPLKRKAGTLKKKAKAKAAPESEQNLAETRTELENGPKEEVKEDEPEYFPKQEAKTEVVEEEGERVYVYEPIYEPEYPPKKSKKSRKRRFEITYVPKKEPKKKSKKKEPK